MVLGNTLDGRIGVALGGAGQADRDRPAAGLHLQAFAIIDQEYHTSGAECASIFPIRHQECAPCMGALNPDSVT